ncbi:Uncharacterised protein [Bordetella pertussis]|nr:Uncharacterised protein [Bordetella pertussis]
MTPGRLLSISTSALSISASAWRRCAWSFRSSATPALPRLK